MRKLKYLITEAVKADVETLMGAPFVNEWENAAKALIDFADGKYNGNNFSDTYRTLIFKCGNSMQMRNFDGNPKRLLKLFSDTENTLIDMAFETAKLFDYDFIKEQKKTVNDNIEKAKKLVNDYIEKKGNQ